MNPAVRYNYFLRSLGKFNYLKGKLIVKFCRFAIFHDQVFGCYKTFNTIRKCNNSALIGNFDYGTFMSRIHGKYRFKNIPGILFKLFVTKAQSPVILIYFKYYYIDVFTN